MNMNNLKGFVFYVDILGFSALTQGKIQLTEDDFNIWQVSKHFQTSGNQEFAANILIIFRKILANCQSKYPTVNFTQLSDCAFVWSERRCVKMRTFFFYAQSPDFHKQGLCYYLKILYL